MFALAGFIGQLADFILKKVLGNRLDLTLDKKMRAAKAFLHFYDALIQIESVSFEFLKLIQPVVNGEQVRLFRAPFDQIAKEADKATQQFVKSFQELHEVVGIYDPALYIMLGDIVSFKAALGGLPFQSSDFAKRMTFNISPNPNSVFYLQSLIPTHPLASQTLEHMYEMASKIKRQPSKENIAAWPQDLLSSLVQDNFKDESIADNNIGLIKQLNEMVTKNIPLLSESRKNFGLFLKNNFSMEDILYFKINN